MIFQNDLFGFAGDNMAGRSDAPPVAVIIPCYNYGDYLPQAVSSVVAQTFTGFEIIIVNDGSTDNTHDLAQSLINQYPEIAITCIDQENSGRPSIARNRGISAARSRYILCLDADDWLAPDFLTECLGCFESNPGVSLVYPDQVHVARDQNIYQASLDYDKNELLYKNLMPTATLFLRQAWLDTGGYRENLKAYEDWDFWIACAACGHYGKRVPKPLFYYRVHSGSLSSYSDGHDEELRMRIIMNNPGIYDQDEISRARSYFEAFDNEAANSANPKVSVVIPCYDQARYLADSVASVVAQTYRDWEIIIINDGSNDDTASVAAGLIEKYSDYKIKSFDQQNMGLSAARNEGVRRSRGDYILPLDADDMIEPLMLEKCAAALDDDPNIAIVYTDVREFGESSREIPSIEFNFNVLCSMNYITATALFRRKAWIDAGGYNEAMRHGYEDWDFWISCAERGLLARRIAAPLFLYRKHAGSMIHSTSAARNNHLKAQIVLNHPAIYTELQQQWARLALDGNEEALALETGHYIPDIVKINLPGAAAIKENNTHLIDREPKMRVLFTMYGWDETGGGTIFPKAVAMELAARGYEVHVFSASLRNDPAMPPYSIERRNEAGVGIYELYNRPAAFIDPDNPGREILDPAVTARFNEVLDEVRPSIVHFHNFHGLTFDLARAARERGIASCYTPHNYHMIDPHLYMFNDDLSLWHGVDMIENSAAVKRNPSKLDDYKRRIDTTRRLMNEWVDITLAVSTRQRALLIAHGASPGKIIVVHQAGPAIDRLWADDSLTGLSRRRVGDHLRFGFIGGVMPHKGVHLIVAAAQYFIPNDVEFHVYGFVSEQYLALLKEIDRKGMVTFHGEYSKDDLAQIAGNLDVAIVPSIWEDCAPLVLAELGAMRLPVIAARIGGAPDFISEAVNGFLYEHDSIESLIKTIMYCMMNPAMLSDMRLNMRPAHSFRKYMDQLEHIYDILANRHPFDPQSLWLMNDLAASAGATVAELHDRDIIAYDEPSIREFLSIGGIQLLNYDIINESADEVDLNISVRIPKPVRIEEFMDNDTGAGQSGNEISPAPPEIEPAARKDASEATAGDRPSTNPGAQGGPGEFLGISFDTRQSDRTLFTEMQDPYNYQNRPGPPYLNIVWEGSQFVYHSLALINREQCSNLIATGLAEVTIVPYENETFSPYGNPKYETLLRHDVRYKPAVPEYVSKLPYVWIRHQWPPSSEVPKGAKWIINQPWEYSALRKDFLEIFRQADEVWTPSTFSRRCFVDSGLDFNKVQVIPNGIDPEIFKPTGPDYQLDSTKRFKFLYVGGTIFRKGCDVLLGAYLKAFTAGDNVSLVIKDMGGDSFYRGQTLKDQIKKHQEFANSPEIIYIEEYLGESEMASLYRACDVFVSPYRGEGFSLPALEAMASGLPVIVTAGGATDDFVSDDYGWKIPSQRQSIGDMIDGHPLTGEAFLLEPDAVHLGWLLKNIYDNPADVFSRGARAQFAARTRWTWMQATLKVLARLDSLYGLGMQQQAAQILTSRDDGSIFTGRAEECLMSADLERSREYFAAALISPGLNDKYRLFCLLRLASIALLEDKPTAADEWAGEAANLAPHHPDVLYIRAKIYSARKEWTDSMNTFTEIFEGWQRSKYETLIGIGHDDLLAGTAEGIFAEGDPDGAYRLYSEALRINPNNPEACLGAARCMLLVDMKDEARRMLEWAVKLDPQMKEARKLLEELG